MKRYSQPKAGTNDYQVQRDLDNQNKSKDLKAFEIMRSLQKTYRGDLTNREWQ